jgi:chaperonin GroEL
MHSHALYGSDARAAMLRGVLKLSKVVGLTLGPTGRNVALCTGNEVPRITRDGVTVSKEIELPNPWENMGAKLVNAAAQKTCDAAGDGTTTCVILAAAIFQEGLRLVEAGFDPVALKRGIDKGVLAAVARLSDIKRKVAAKREIASVAALAANNDPAIGALLTAAFERVGKDGAITIEDGHGLDSTLEVKEGMTFDRGWASPAFVTEPTNHLAVLEDCFVLVHEAPLHDVRDLVSFLAKLAGRSLLIVAEDFGKEPMAALVMNHLKGKIKVCAVRAPQFGVRRRASLVDLAVLTGGTAVTEDMGQKLAALHIEHVGRAKLARVEKDSCVIINTTEKEAVTQHCNRLRRGIAAAHSEYEKEKLTERIAKLTGGVAIVKVGGATEMEMRQTKARIEDALHAARSAVSGGIVAGGGAALLRCTKAVESLAIMLDDAERAGAYTVARALAAPLRQIAANSGVEAAVVLDGFERFSEAYPDVAFDANTKNYVDAFMAGIIDPFEVSRAALEAAASVAGLLLTTDLALTQERNVR